MGKPRQGDPLGRKNDEPASVEEIEEALLYANATVVAFEDQADTRARRNLGVWTPADTMYYANLHAYLNKLLTLREEARERGKSCS